MYRLRSSRSGLCARQRHPEDRRQQQYDGMDCRHTHGQRWNDGDNRLQQKEKARQIELCPQKIDIYFNNISTIK